MKKLSEKAQNMLSRARKDKTLEETPVKAKPVKTKLVKAKLVKARPEELGIKGIRSIDVFVIFDEFGSKGKSLH